MKTFNNILLSNRPFPLGLQVSVILGKILRLDSNTLKVLNENPLIHNEFRKTRHNLEHDSMLLKIHNLQYNVFKNLKMIIV